MRMPQHMPINQSILLLRFR